MMVVMVDLLLLLLIVVVVVTSVLNLVLVYLVYIYLIKMKKSSSNSSLITEALKPFLQDSLYEFDAFMITTICLSYAKLKANWLVFNQL